MKTFSELFSIPGSLFIITFERLLSLVGWKKKLKEFIEMPVDICQTVQKCGEWLYCCYPSSFPIYVSVY